MLPSTSGKLPMEGARGEEPTTASSECDHYYVPTRYAPDQSVELTYGAHEHLSQVFQKHKNQDGFISGAEMELLILRARNCPQNKSLYKDAVSTTTTGGLSFESFLSQGALMCRLESDKFVEYMRSLGYDGVSPIYMSSKKSIDREWCKSERDVYLCFVFGAKRSGKSALLDRFLGRPFSDKYAASVEGRYAVNVVDGPGNRQKILALREIPEDKVEGLLYDQEFLSDCDIALFVYDCSDPPSFEKTVDILMKVATHAECTGYLVPCVIVAAKHDLRADFQSLVLSISVSQNLGIDFFIPTSAVLGLSRDFFQRIVQSAELPHVNIPETDFGRRKQYNCLVNGSPTVISGAGISTYVFHLLKDISTALLVITRDTEFVEYPLLPSLTSYTVAKNVQMNIDSSVSRVVNKKYIFCVGGMDRMVLGVPSADVFYWDISKPHSLKCIVGPSLRAGKICPTLIVVGSKLFAFSMFFKPNDGTVCEVLEVADLSRQQQGCLCAWDYKCFPKLPPLSKYDVSSYSVVSFAANGCTLWVSLGGSPYHFEQGAFSLLYNLWRGVWKSAWLEPLPFHGEGQFVESFCYGFPCNMALTDCSYLGCYKAKEDHSMQLIQKISLPNFFPHLPPYLFTFSIISKNIFSISRTYCPFDGTTDDVEVDLIEIQCSTSHSKHLWHRTFRHERRIFDTIGATPLSQVVISKMDAEREVKKGKVQKARERKKLGKKRWFTGGEQ